MLWRYHTISLRVAGTFWHLTVWKLRSRHAFSAFWCATSIVIHPRPLQHFGSKSHWRYLHYCRSRSEWGTAAATRHAAFWGKKKLYKAQCVSRCMWYMLCTCYNAMIFMQIYIFEFCVDLQFQFLIFEFRSDLVIQSWRFGFRILGSGSVEWCDSPPQISMEEGDWMGLDVYVCIYIYIAGFKVSGNMWTQSTVLLSFFELLSGCCYGATSVPTSVSTGHKKNCHCTLQEHLKFPAVQAGASWVGNWPLHPLISLSPFQTYCCWFWCSTWSNGKHHVFLFDYMFALLHIALVNITLLHTCRQYLH